MSLQVVRTLEYLIIARRTFCLNLSESLKLLVLINSIVKYLKIPLDLKYRTSGIVEYLKIPLDLKYRTS
ncbi:hypothetical protein HJC23_014031, partial [Cyclotella cryptica]